MMIIETRHCRHSSFESLLQIYRATISTSDWSGWLPPGSRVMDGV